MKKSGPTIVRRESFGMVCMYGRAGNEMVPIRVIARTYAMNETSVLSFLMIAICFPRTILMPSRYRSLQVAIRDVAVTTESQSKRT